MIFENHALTLTLMRSRHEQQDPIESSAYRELQVLSEVENSPEVTQREISRHVGIALGLTNLLLRNLVQKGYVRATRAGWKRWIYNLTPEGFSHKIHLTADYVNRVLNHYQRVRHTLREQLDPLPLNQESRVAIYGTGDLAELVYLGLREMAIEEIDIFDPVGSGEGRFLGMPVRDISALRPGDYDRVLIAILGNAEEHLERLSERGLLPERVVTFFKDGKAREDEQWPTTGL